MPALSELTAQFAEKHKQLADFFGQYKSSDLTPDQVDQVRAWNVELNEIGVKRDRAVEVEGIESKTREIGTELAKPVGRPFSGQPASADEKSMRSFGDAICSVLFTKSGSIVKGQDLEVKDYTFSEFKASPRGVDAEFKTTMTTTAGWTPEARRSGRVELSLQNPLTIVDILPTIPVSMGTYTYMKETTFTNNADTVLEAQTYPESALALTPQTATVYKVGTFIPVTEEQISDVDGMRAYIDNRLQLMVMQKLEQKVLSGSGTNDIAGFTTQVTQSQAMATDPIFDAIFKAMVKVRTVGMANPDAVIMNPNDFSIVRLARTEDGVYIMGNPDQLGLDRLFGVRTVMSLYVTAGTALVGDFSAHCALLTRWGLDVLATNSDGTNFIKDIITVKARIRAGLAVIRPEAFCKVTGIA